MTEMDKVISLDITNIKFRFVSMDIETVKSGNTVNQLIEREFEIGFLEGKACCESATVMLCKLFTHSPCNDVSLLEKTLP